MFLYTSKKLFSDAIEGLTTSFHQQIYMNHEGVGHYTRPDLAIRELNLNLFMKKVENAYLRLCGYFGTKVFLDVYIDVVKNGNRCD